jgi:hypothetical protein
MNLTQIIGGLRAELKQIEEVILVLERLTDARGKRRGRPPKDAASAKLSKQSKQRLLPKRPHK